MEGTRQGRVRSKQSGRDKGCGEEKTTLWVRVRGCLSGGKGGRRGSPHIHRRILTLLPQLTLNALPFIMAKLPPILPAVLLNNTIALADLQRSPQRPAAVRERRGRHRAKQRGKTL